MAHYGLYEFDRLPLTYVMGPLCLLIVTGGCVEWAGFDYLIVLFISDSMMWWCVQNPSVSI